MLTKIDSIVGYVGSQTELGEAYCKRNVYIAHCHHAWSLCLRAVLSNGGAEKSLEFGLVGSIHPF